MAEKNRAVISDESLLTCGVIMPISAIDGCDQKHWQDVKEIIFKSIAAADMLPSLVSDDVEVGVIHKRIVQNIFDNTVIVCDISAKNPNVMLEFGMRLAFDKPVIVVKDDKTSYSFDSSPIEHLSYPRDLHYQSVIDFQRSLEAKIRAMKDGRNENSFLKSFGTFKTATIEHEAGTPMDLILEELSFIKSALRQSRPYQDYGRIAQNLDHRLIANIHSRSNDAFIEICVRGNAEVRSEFANAISLIKGFESLDRIMKDGLLHEHFRVNIAPGLQVDFKRRLRVLTHRINLRLDLSENGNLID